MRNPKQPVAPTGTPQWGVTLLRDLILWIQQTLRQPMKLPAYTVAQVAALDPNDFYAGVGGNSFSTLIFVTNESGGSVPAFCDGTNFRRVTDRNIVS